MNILVLCTGNSARSILLETILNAKGTGRVRAFSAGSHPAGRVHPQSLSILAENGLPTDGLRSKSWDEFAGPEAPRLDLVITVCGSAAEETCPIWPGAPLRAHWGVDDPAAAPEREQPAAFATVFAVLTRRAQALLRLPLESMNREEIQNELNRIGMLE